MSFIPPHLTHLAELVPGTLSQYSVLLKDVTILLTLLPVACCISVPLWKQKQKFKTRAPVTCFAKFNYLEKL